MKNLWLFSRLTSPVFRLTYLTEPPSHKTSEDPREVKMKLKFAKGFKPVKGRIGSIVISGYKGKEGLYVAKRYIYPELTKHNAEFGEIARAIAKKTWKAASAGFKSDMQLYTEAWNVSPRDDDEPGHNITVFNVFNKACYAVAEANGFDLRNLTIDSFGGEEGDLLGTMDPNVGNLVKAAGFSDCGVELAELESLI